jgi:5-hydroxyisourate hydrolase-like protein (transthyretin family)
MRITRARLVLGTTAVAGVLGLLGAGVPAVSALAGDAPGYRTVRALTGDDHRLCGDAAVQRTADGVVGCAHEDVPPPGVDLTKPVATAVLEAREGGRARAVRAAQEEGVPVPAAVAAGTDRVLCDGDGSSGYRTQAMYVTTSDRVNRFAAVQDEIRQWAAGVDAVFNLSAAKTGGVRNVRYVTDSAADGSCTAKLLNVTLPPGSFSSFSATVTAMRNLGYTSPSRKYLMWVDGTGQCGIAQTYLDSRADQANANNGSYSQFARIDTACWGGSVSVEAHELAHTLGSVQNDAPHSTKVGHCWDESDRMCYADGGSYPMRQVCPADQEPLLDCNDDDYYSTYPPAGSYLATHWNTASSRFLIGGGDGTDGGTRGVPTRLGGTVSVNNPAVPGVAAQVQATLEVPTGRTTATTWSSSRRDCVFADPRAEQTSVTCAAGLTTAAPITLTAVDSSGEKITRSTALTFDKTPRPATVTAAVDGLADATYVVCPTGRGVLSAAVRDQASGAPVKGMTVTWYRTTGSLAPVRVASAVTDDAGRATPAALPLLAGSYRATTSTAGAFPSVSGGTTSVTAAPAACPTALSASLSADQVMAGSPATVSGRLTRTLPDGSSSGAAGETVSVELRAAGATTWSRVATATTTADGSYSAVVRSRVSGTLRVTLPARVAYRASVSPSVPLTVNSWQTAVTETLSAADVMAGAPVTVSGVLTQSDGTSSSALAGQSVQVTYPIAGGRTSSVRVSTRADGTYSVSVRPTGSGPVSASYAGSVGWQPATQSLPLTATPWQTALTTRVSAPSVAPWSPVTVSGTLTKTGAGSTTPYASAYVTITYPTTAGRVATVTARTTATGGFAVVVRTGSSGQLRARFAGGAGIDPADAAPIDLTVG